MSEGQEEGGSNEDGEIGRVLMFMFDLTRGYHIELCLSRSVCMYMYAIHSLCVFAECGAEHKDWVTDIHQSISEVLEHKRKDKSSVLFDRQSSTALEDTYVHEHTCDAIY
jgi:hypothetical protein